MRKSNQESKPSQNESSGSGVGKSVVNDLMRVYENLTQSSTPQAIVPDASKTLSMAYNNDGAPQTVTAPGYSVPPGYTLQPIAGQHQYHQQQKQAKIEVTAQTNTTSYNSGAGADAHAVSYQQQPAGNQGYSPVAAGPVSSVKNENSDNHMQTSGEESQAIARTSSVISKVSQLSMHNLQQTASGASSESESGGGARSRRKRKPSYDQGSLVGGGKKSGRGKKSKKEDGRWSKRFTWPEDLHRDFVSAIFDVGLKHSSPSAILEHMPKHEQITTERIKSHLQKYRLHRVKSKKEFISSYEASLRNLQQNQSSNAPLVSGSSEVAAHLTASTLGNIKANSGTGFKEDATDNAIGNPNQEYPQPHHFQPDSDDKDSLLLPQLTEAEKASPIGSAMGYLMGLFFSLKQQLMIQRSLEDSGEKAKGNTFFSSSPASITPSRSINPGANNPSAAATAAAVAAGVEFTADNSRSNIEVNSMIKREMQNQMALQNKMRALKQQELNKYKHVASDAIMTLANHDGLPIAPAMDSNSNPMEENFAAGVAMSEQALMDQHQDQPPATSTGEFSGANPQGNNNNSSLMGIDNSEDFWHTDVMDDQLFEFLLNS